jgi:hypothetical protein
MVEQRPFKALVVGSSPTQPKDFHSNSKVCGAAMEAILQVVEHD